MEPPGIAMDTCSPPFHQCRENSRILSSLQTHRSDLARLRDECASRAEQCLSLSQRLSVTQTALAARSAALKETLHAWKQCKIELSKATREAESYKAEADDAKKMAKGEQLRGREKSKVEAEVCDTVERHGYELDHLKTTLTHGTAKALSAALVRIRSLERRENHLQTLLRERGNELQECRKMLKEKGTELELVVAKHETRNEVSSESKLSATPMTVGPTSPQTSFESRGTQATIVSDHNEGACPRCRHCRSALKKQRATEEEVAARAAEIAATVRTHNVLASSVFCKPRCSSCGSMHRSFVSIHPSYHFHRNFW
ncbi:hypothetical protein M427DRAFT_314123 [Gonapodya prolifera JEL478]|uniref:Uncharacterized protein n=1 Tax=Gonapodya prolifera (strain JEL478) TaxID=1344416 RepID=A0A139AX04_GONPJ|nr:hypothetical protein M427DRAFT_314123 [Gonapodya prolifera JEL478]|eukprot:KXS21237.1 hypothetical protein M427DRAFT_314123 [Gonapodya prolifera JEL478]